MKQWIEIWHACTQKRTDRTIIERLLVIPNYDVIVNMMTFS